MIKIDDISRCCGCMACVQSCPVGCITTELNEQGLEYPVANVDKCINCNLCERVCPFLNNSRSQILRSFAAISSNEEQRMKSSSGGIFSLLAESTTRVNGVVFGARFDDEWNVVHDYCETIEGIAAFRGSKYLQSRIGDSYRKAEHFLKDGRMVLFSGTPCQIAGLKLFLRKEYDNLLLVEVACHGVPSPKIWKDYLSTICNNASHINFRDKRLGWENYSYIVRDDGKEVLNECYRDNIYSRGFLRNLTLRPSCFNCPSKDGKSGSDITIADFWGIDPLLPGINDHKGISLVITRSKKGQTAINGLEAVLYQVPNEEATRYNTAIIHSTSKPKLYNYFWKCYQTKGFSAVEHTLAKSRPSFFKKLTQHLARIFVR